MFEEEASDLVELVLALIGFEREVGGIGVRDKGQQGEIHGSISERYISRQQEDYDSADVEHRTSGRNEEGDPAHRGHSYPLPTTPISVIAVS